MKRPVRRGDGLNIEDCKLNTYGCRFAPSILLKKLLSKTFEP